jgi:hypothetical protein
MNITYMLITVGTAIIAGIFASFIKPLIDWNIELKRTRLESRKKLISNVRDIISMESFDVLNFRDSITYSLLCEHLSDNLNKTINIDESDYIHIFESLNSDIDSEHKYKILKEVNHLAKKWKIE